MKRILLSVAIVAVAASCSQNEVFDIAQTNVIGFSTLNDRVTKAANDNDDDYKVYAALNGVTTAWYIDDYVSCGSSTDATSAAVGSYYWPIDKTPLAFYAYAPYYAENFDTTEGGELYTDNDVLTGVTDNSAEASQTISLLYVVPTDAQEDFTVATPVTSQSYDINDGVVGFTFSHMLAKVTIVLDLEESFGEVYEISESYNNAADDSFTATFTPLKDKFTVNAMDASIVVPTAETTEATEAITSPGESAATTYSGYQSYMIAPQEFANCVLQINGITIRHIATGTLFFANVGVDLTELTLDGTELGGVDATFDAGKHYVFTVVISGASTDDDENTEDPIEITFSATTTSWDYDSESYNAELEQVEQVEEDEEA